MFPGVRIGVLEVRGRLGTLQQGEPAKAAE
jgi:hypothetical protein